MWEGCIMAKHEWIAGVLFVIVVAALPILMVL
jgi:hypothetical protein